MELLISTTKAIYSSPPNRFDKQKKTVTYVTVLSKLSVQFSFG